MSCVIYAENGLLQLPGQAQRRYLVSRGSELDSGSRSNGYYHE
jgi:hypothetical protein